MKRSAWIRSRTNIHRDDRGAWDVHITREGKLYTGHFPDAVWGGREKSYLAARRFRDGLLRRIEPDTRVRRRVPRGVRSETGVVGVILERYFVEGREYERFIANWRDADGRTKRRRFSVGRYGEQRAFELAVEARTRGVGESRAIQLARQREDARSRLLIAPAMPRKVKDPKSRKGMRMPPRNPDRRALNVHNRTGRRTDATSR